MNIPLVDLKAQHNSIKEEIDQAIQGVLRSGQFILGPEVKALEEGSIIVIETTRIRVRSLPIGQELR